MFSLENAPMWYKVTSGAAKTARYMAKGTMKKMICDVPETMPRLNPSRSSCENISAISVNMAVVMGTGRNE